MVVNFLLLIRKKEYLFFLKFIFIFIPFVGNNFSYISLEDGVEDR